MKRYADLLADALTRVREIMPWDLAARLEGGRPPLLLDVREPAEFAQARIAGSINVPRGVLEQACEWDFDETVPELARGRNLPIVVVCRSGNRSVLAADVMQQLGFADVVSLKTGLRGWNDFEQPLADSSGRPLDGDTAEVLLAPRLRPEQQRPRAGAPPQM
jgi:rhodanese-related sulfurtransferase